MRALLLFGAFVYGPAGAALMVSLVASPKTSSLGRWLIAWFMLLGAAAFLHVWWTLRPASPAGGLRALPDRKALLSAAAVACTIVAVALFLVMPADPSLAETVRPLVASACACGLVVARALAGRLAREQANPDPADNRPEQRPAVPRSRGSAADLLLALFVGLPMLMLIVSGVAQRALLEVTVPAETAGTVGWWIGMLFSAPILAATLARQLGWQRKPPVMAAWGIWIGGLLLVAFAPGGAKGSRRNRSEEWMDIRFPGFFEHAIVAMLAGFACAMSIILLRRLVRALSGGDDGGQSEAGQARPRSAGRKQRRSLRLRRRRQRRGRSA